MSRRKKIYLAASLVVLMAIGAELMIRPLTLWSVCVQVINEGDTPMEDVVVRHAGTSVRMGEVAAGKATNVWLASAPKGTLSIEFSQKGNPSKGFQVSDFDPGELLDNSFKLILKVNTNQVERSVEDDDVPTLNRRIKDFFSEWFDFSPFLPHY